MSELWLPSDRLTRTTIDKIPRGHLAVLPPSGKEAQIPPVGIRFEAPNCLMLLALTPFGNGLLAGDAFDVSQDNRTAFTVDAKLTVEANVGVKATRDYARDFRPGELVNTTDGIGIVAYFGRINPVMQNLRPIKVETWTKLEVETSDFIFGAWRLRIDIEGLKPIYWNPEFGPASS